ncbi:hypothetical protein F4806DRAFT_507999 [Annulohypoxylon nitens]|nr:hypothetical protein F4806DRAFT_507999 [Annulohypoxylon nitens]
MSNQRHQSVPYVPPYRRKEQSGSPHPAVMPHDYIPQRARSAQGDETASSSGSVQANEPDVVDDCSGRVKFGFSMDKSYYNGSKYAGWDRKFYILNSSQENPFAIAYLLVKLEDTRYFEINREVFVTGNLEIIPEYLKRLAGSGTKNELIYSPPTWQQAQIAAFLEREVHDAVRWEFVGWFKVHLVGAFGPIFPDRRDLLERRMALFAQAANRAQTIIPDIDYRKKWAVIKFLRQDGEDARKPPEIKDDKKYDSGRWKRNAPPPLQLQQTLVEREEKLRQKGGGTSYPTTGYRATRPGPQGGGSPADEDLPSPLDISDWRVPTKFAHRRHWDIPDGAPDSPASQPQPSAELRPTTRQESPGQPGVESRPVVLQECPQRRVEVRPTAREETPAQPRIVSHPDARQEGFSPDSRAGLTAEAPVPPSPQGPSTRHESPAQPRTAPHADVHEEDDQPATLAELLKDAPLSPSAIQRLPYSRHAVGPPGTQMQQLFQQTTYTLDARAQLQARFANQAWPQPTSHAQHYQTHMPTVYEESAHHQYPQYVNPRDVMHNPLVPPMVQAQNQPVQYQQGAQAQYQPAQYHQGLRAQNVQYADPFMGSNNPEGPDYPEGWQ